jgi:hypothetical protein
MFEILSMILIIPILLAGGFFGWYIEEECQTGGFGAFVFAMISIGILIATPALIFSGKEILAGALLLSCLFVYCMIGLGIYIHYRIGKNEEIKAAVEQALCKKDEETTEFLKRHNIL